MFKKIFQLSVSAVFVAASFNAGAAPVPIQKDEVKTVDTAQSKESRQAAEQLSKKLNSLKSLTAHFEQTSISQDGRLKTESGQMQLKRPSLFRWHTVKPYDVNIVADGKKVWQVDHDLQQIIVQKQDDKVSNTPAQLLIGDSQGVLANYTVSIYKKGTTERFTLIPVGAPDMFERLGIAFEGGKLSSMDIDSLGGKRRIVFSSVKENGRIKDDVFKVSQPKSYELFDETRM